MMAAATSITPCGPLAPCARLVYSMIITTKIRPTPRRKESLRPRLEAFSIRAMLFSSISAFRARVAAERTRGAKEL